MTTFLGGVVDRNSADNVHVDRYVGVPQPLLDDAVAAGFVESHGTQDDFEPGNGFEERYFVSGDLGGGLWLRSVIPVRVRFEAGEFVAEAKSLGIHAFGETQIAALIALRGEIAEQFEFLEGLGSRLSPRMVREAEHLRSAVARTDA